MLSGASSHKPGAAKRRNPIPLAVLAGPTASGKSSLALALAQALDGVVINADSMQVYRELRVLTARPAPEDEARVPHRLYGFLDAAERCSAGRWAALAEAEIAEAAAAGLLPIVVGGTGFYLETLLRGLSPIPDVPAEVHAAAVALLDRLGLEAFRELVAERDPAAAGRIGRGDRQRLIRAYEVLEATGRPLSAWQQEAPAPPLHPLAADVFLIDPPRAELYSAIDTRVTAMVAGGALDEVRAILARGLDPGLPAMKVLGLPELAAHIEGGLPLEEAIDRAQRATRRFAKRQLTWFRHRLPEARRLVAQDLESLKREILPKIRHALLTR